MVKALTCPKCGCRKFQMGPSAGLSQNMRCENGHKWNAPGPFPMQDIGTDTEDVPGCTCDKD